MVRYGCVSYGSSLEKLPEMNCGLLSEMSCSGTEPK